MNKAYTYYEPYGLSAITGMEALAIIVVFALIIVAIIWVLGGFDAPAFPKPALKGQIEKIFNEEVARAADTGNSSASEHLRKAQSQVLDQLKKVGAI